MEITRNNYEAFLLDLAEGNLSDQKERELMHFLECNSDLHFDADILNYSLEGEIEVFPDKERLKKGAVSNEITKENYQQFCIARNEGDLSEHLEKKLDRFIKLNPNLQKDAELFGVLNLKPDMGILFHKKDQIKKRTVLKPTGIRKRSLWSALSVAASMALLISVWQFIQTEVSEPVIVGTVNPINEIIPEPVQVASEVDLELLPSSDPTPYIRVHVPEESSIRSLEIADNVQIPEREVGLPQARKIDLSKIQLNEHQPEELLNIADLATLRSSSGGRLTPSQSGGNASRINQIYSFFRGQDDIEDVIERVNLKDFADAGLQGISQIAGSLINFERQFDENGNVIGVEFSAANVQFSRTSGK